MFKHNYGVIWRKNKHAILLWLIILLHDYRCVYTVLRKICELRNHLAIKTIQFARYKVCWISWYKHFCQNFVRYIVNVCEHFIMYTAVVLWGEIIFNTTYVLLLWFCGFVQYVIKNHILRISFLWLTMWHLQSPVWCNWHNSLYYSCGAQIKIGKGTLSLMS